MIAFYHSFGEYDGVIISQAPDDNSIAVGVLAVVSAGYIKAIKTATLLGPEDAM